MSQLHHWAALADMLLFSWPSMDTAECTANMAHVCHQEDFCWSVPGPRTSLATLLNRNPGGAYVFMLHPSKIEVLRVEAELSWSYWSLNSSLLTCHALGMTMYSFGSHIFVKFGKVNYFNFNKLRQLFSFTPTSPPSHFCVRWFWSGPRDSVELGYLIYI